MDFCNGKVINVPLLSKSLPSNTKEKSEVEITLEGIISQFDSEKKRILISTVAAVLNIDASSIKVKRIVSGSIKITLELPMDKGLILLEFSTWNGFSEMISSITSGTIQIMNVAIIKGKWWWFKVFLDKVKLTFSKSIWKVGGVIIIPVLAVVYISGGLTGKNTLLVNNGESKIGIDTTGNRSLKVEANKSYYSLLEAGNNYYNSREYNKAKDKYNEAIEVAEGFGIDVQEAKDSIGKCNEKLERQINKVNYDLRKSKGDQSLKNGNDDDDDAQKNYETAQSYMDIKEIQDVIREVKRKRVQEQNYQKHLSEGDRYFRNGEYNQAKSSYQKAQEIDDTVEIRGNIKECEEKLKESTNQYLDSSNKCNSIMAV